MWILVAPLVQRSFADACRYLNLINVEFAFDGKFGKSDRAREIPLESAAFYSCVVCEPTLSLVRSLHARIGLERSARIVAVVVNILSLVKSFVHSFASSFVSFTFCSSSNVSSLSFFCFSCLCLCVLITRQAQHSHFHLASGSGPCRCPTNKSIRRSVRFYSMRTALHTFHPFWIIIITNTIVSPIRRWWCRFPSQSMRQPPPCPTSRIDRLRLLNPTPCLLTITVILFPLSIRTFRCNEFHRTRLPHQFHRPHRGLFHRILCQIVHIILIDKRRCVLNQ